MSRRAPRGGKGSNQYETKPPAPARDATGTAAVPSASFVSADPFGSDGPVEGDPVSAAAYTDRLVDRVRARRDEIMRDHKMSGRVGFAA